MTIYNIKFQYILELTFGQVRNQMNSSIACMYMYAVYLFIGLYYLKCSCTFEKYIHTYLKHF